METRFEELNKELKKIDDKYTNKIESDTEPTERGIRGGKVPEGILLQLDRMEKEIEKIKLHLRVIDNALGNGV